MKKLIITILNNISVGLAYILGISNPFSKKICRLWRLTKMRSRVANPIPNSTQLDGQVHIIGSGNIKLGEYCRIGKDVIFETQDNGSIILGNHVRINQGSVLVAYDNMSIGDDCLIGEYCSIRDANHGIHENILIRIQPHTFEAITIENDCWIARGVTVLKGVQINHGSIVGANSVVTRSIKQNTIVAGIPANPIKKRAQ